MSPGKAQFSHAQFCGSVYRWEHVAQSTTKSWDGSGYHAREDPDRRAENHCEASTGPPNGPGPAMAARCTPKSTTYWGGGSHALVQAVAG